MTALYYSDDLVTLYHGNCLEITDWLDADVLVTDPPYGVSMHHRFGDARNTKRQRHVYAAMRGDDSPQTRDAMLAAWDVVA